MKRLKTWFNKLSTIGKIASVTTACVFSLAAIGAATQSSSSITDANKTSATPADTPKTRPNVKQAVVEIKSVSATEAVPFSSSTVSDPNLAQGSTDVRTTGVNGVRTITYDVTYTDGNETGRTETGNNVTIPPVNEVVAKGTKAPQSQSTSCPNGTYVNSNGNRVCRPYESNSAPAGASAQCEDGTYSFSQSRRGTCSGHGGVAQWL